MRISDILKASCIAFTFVLDYASSHTEQTTTSQIIEIESITELSTAVNLSEISNTIALFDCDGVLFNNREAVLQPSNLHFLIRSAKTGGRTFDTSALANITRSASKELLEPKIPEYIKNLQEKRIPLFVFTQCSSDQVVRNERCRKLYDLGMDFSSTLDEQHNYHAFKFPEEILHKSAFQTHATQPILESGILYCGGVEKRLVLPQFLDWLLSPEVSLLSCPLSDLNILFVDDSMTNLQGVKSACEKLKIKNFIGVHYTAIENIHKEINPEIANWQIDRYKTTGKWPPDYAVHLCLLLTKKDF